MGWMLGSSCVLCDRQGPAICRRCWYALPGPGPGGPRALFAYEGGARQLIASLKFQGRRCLLPILGRALAQLVLHASEDTAVDGGALDVDALDVDALDGDALDVDPLDIVSWAPTSLERRRQRSYDQAELLARRVAFELRLPSRGLLARVPGPAQTGLRRTERQLAPRFVALGDVARLRVLLIDDVVTTGATLAEGSRVLLEAGAAAVVGLALAKTPARLPVTASGRSVGVAHVTTG